MATIKKVSLKDVQREGFKPEPHTVSLKDNGEWWGVIENGHIISCLCVQDKHGGKYFSENYTDKRWRKKGVFSKLLDYVVNSIYINEDCIAHCLESSVLIYKKTGFEFVRTRDFKHGKQYFMKKSGRQNI